MRVCRADALERPGQFVRVGAIHAFRNLCRHRGARLCTEESGRLDKAIRCMCHACTYCLDGRSIAAPNMGDMPDLVREDYGLHRVRTEQWLGYVWVNLDQQAQPPAAQTEPQVLTTSRQPRDRRPLRDRPAGVASTIVYEVDSNWKAIL